MFVKICGLRSPEAVKGGQANVGPVVQKLGGSCKNCHDDYRKKE